MNTVIPPRPLRPGTIAVRADWTRKGPGWAIVSDEPIGFLMGWKRGYGESHAGYWVYRFVTWGKAAKWAHRIQEQRYSL